MAIRPKTQVGTIGCLCCGHEVPVKAGDSGTLNFCCSWCDFPGYAKAGTQAHKIVSEKMTKITKPIPDGEKPVTPAPEQKPAKQPSKGVFEL